MERNSSGEWKVILFLCVLAFFGVAGWLIGDRVSKALTDTSIYLCLGSGATLLVVTVVIVLLSAFNFVQVRADDLGEVKRLEAMAKLGYGMRVPGAPNINVLPSGNGQATNSPYPVPYGDYAEGKYQDSVNLQ